MLLVIIADWMGIMFIMVNKQLLAYVAFSLILSSTRGSRCEGVQNSGFVNPSGSDDVILRTSPLVEQRLTKLLRGGRQTSSSYHQQVCNLHVQLSPIACATKPHVHVSALG